MTSWTSPGLCRAALVLAALSCGDPTPPESGPPETGYFSVLATGVRAANREIAGFNRRRDFAGSDGAFPFRVTGGVEHALQTRPGAAGVVVALNESGEAVGHDIGSGEPHPLVVRWPDGSDAPLHIPFDATSAIDLNDAGDVLVTPGAWSAAEQRDTAFVLWTHQGRETVSSRSIPTWPQLTLTGVAMNDARTILAYEYSLGWAGPVLVYADAPADTACICPFPVGPPPGQSPIALNDAGDYILRRWLDDCLVPSAGAPGFPASFRSNARGLNNNGWIVGEFLPESGAPVPALSVRGGPPIVASRLFASDADRDGWTIARLVAINDNNELLAVGAKGATVEFLVLVPRPK